MKKRISGFLFTSEPRQPTLPFLVLMRTHRLLDALERKAVQEREIAEMRVKRPITSRMPVLSVESAGNFHGVHVEFEAVVELQKRSMPAKSAGTERPIGRINGRRNIPFQTLS